jgi:HSP20 family protein
MTQYWLSGPAGRWGSFDRLRREMNELFEQAGAGPRREGAFPPVNLYETSDGYVLTAELPGVESGDIELSVESNRVTLRGERKVEHPQDASLHRVERQAGVFRRTIELPVEVDAEKAEAVHRNGILMLRIPKAPQHKPRQITVKTS